MGRDRLQSRSGPASRDFKSVMPPAALRWPDQTGVKLRCEVHNHGALTYNYVTSKSTVVNLDVSIDCHSTLVEALASRPPARSQSR